MSDPGRPPSAPHNRAIQIAHAARLTLESLGGRPISHANSVFARTCTDALRALAVSAEEVRPHLRDHHRAQIGVVASALRDVSSYPTAQRVSETARLVREDFQLYERLMQVPLDSAPMPVDPLARPGAPRPRRAFVSIGPGIGIGDETKLLDILGQLQVHLDLSDEDLVIFSYCPSIWRTLAPWPVRDLGADPLALFHHIEATEPVPGGGELVCFANFLRRDSLRPFLPYGSRFSLLDIAVGNGEARLLLAGSRTEYRLEGDGPSAGISQALWHLADHLFEGSAPERPLAPPPNRPVGDHPFRLVLSPFTSKASPLTATDWADLVAAAARALTPGRPVVCEIVPGLTPECVAHARDIRRLIQHRLRSRASVALIGQDADGYDADNAIPRVWAHLREADLLLGIDTFTAHLAAKLGTVSVALCLNQNERFWDPSLRSFWFNLEAGDRAVRAAVRLVARLLDPRGRRAPPFAGFVRQCTSLADDLPSRPEAIAARLHPIWNGLPESVRGALGRLDGLRGWPLVHPYLVDGDASAIAALAYSNFARTLYLAGSEQP